MMEEARAMIDEAQLQEQVVEALGAVLDLTLAASECASHDSLKPFESRKSSPLSASQFVRRIVKYGHCSPCCLLVGTIYVHRVGDRIFADQQKSQPTINAFNIQRLLLTAVMLASKFLDDLYCSNKQWALIGDISTQELNALELHFLSLLRFSVSVSRQEYYAASSALKHEGEFYILRRWKPQSPVLHVRSSFDLSSKTTFAESGSEDQASSVHPAGPTSPNEAAWPESNGSDGHPQRVNVRSRGAVCQTAARRLGSEMVVSRNSQAFPAKRALFADPPAGSHACIPANPQDKSTPAMVQVLRGNLSSSQISI